MCECWEISEAIDECFELNVLFSLPTAGLCSIYVHLGIVPKQDYVARQSNFVRYGFEEGRIRLLESDFG